MTTGYSVGDVSRIAHVTVRTLHHYDEIGLLRPSARTDAGYRRYSDSDLERLQRVLCYRDLGFSLDEIAAILDDPAVDPLEHLRRQHELLTGRIERLRRMADTVKRAMEARKMGINLDPAEMLEVFGDFDPTGHADEAERRWGDTAQFEEAQRRTATYTKDDWARHGAEHRELQQRFAAALAGGRPPHSAEVMDLAEEHRQQLNRWMFRCSHEMHRGLGDLYRDDPRFRSGYDQVAPGLAVYVRDAIHANAGRHEG
jgi:DNA-binding transcriptional MerR regulator